MSVPQETARQELDRLRGIHETPKQELERLRATSGPPSKQNFFERFGDDLKTRFGEQGAEIINARVAGDQGFASTALQLTGKVGAGVMMDFLGEAIISGGRGLSNITPDMLEDPLVENATKAGIFLLDTKLGAQGLEAARNGMASYTEFAEEHPVMARNIEAVTNIALLVAPVKGKPKVKTPSAVGRVGEKISRSGRRSAVANRRGFIDELVTPKQTQKVMRDQVKRTTEQGINRRKIVELSPAQKASAREVRKVSGVSAKKTLQGNYNAISTAVTKKADGLMKHLKGLGTKGEYQWTEFARVLNDNVSVLLKESPNLVGDARKSAQRVIEHALRLSANGDKTLAGLLKVRRDLDRWVIKHKPKAFDSEIANATTEAVRAVRTEINGFIGARAPSVPVKKSLQSQSRMLRALDDLEVKAAGEASTKLRRVIQRAIKVIPIRNELVAGLALVGGVGGLGAAAMFMPFIQKLAITYGAYRGGKAIVMSPNTRKGIGQIIKVLDKAGQHTTDPAVLRQLRADRATLVEILKEVKVQTEED